eukprot:1190073-Prorocentrum_minimum.AAC.1
MSSSTNVQLGDVCEQVMRAGQTPGSVAIIVGKRESYRTLGSVRPPAHLAAPPPPPKWGTILLAECKTGYNINYRRTVTYERDVDLDDVRQRASKQRELDIIRELQGERGLLARDRVLLYGHEARSIQPLYPWRV